MNTLDIGEPTDLDEMSDEELDAALGSVDTSSLDAAADKAYDEYLSRWAKEIAGDKES